MDPFARQLSRRQLLRYAAGGVALTGLGPLLAACGDDEDAAAPVATDGKLSGEIDLWWWGEQEAGQSAILAFDAVIKRPVVVTDEMGNDSIAIRQMVFLSLSWDHRVIDGAEAAMFLADLKALLEDADFESDLAGYLPTPKA